MTVNSASFNLPIRLAKSSSASGLLFRYQPVRALAVVQGKWRLNAVFAAIVCLFGNVTVARAAQLTVPGRMQIASRPGAVGKPTCPPQQQTTMTLSKASALMEGARFAEAADTLQPISIHQCDPRVSLLLAAALEQSGALARGEEVLQRAQAAWPSNNSISASLARDYMGDRRLDQAAQALRNFRPTAQTPMQELELAAVVFIASHQLVPAQTVAATAYKSYPSVRTLLLLANAKQLQGRFKEAVTLLSGKRDLYSSSPAFLITLAESEYDSILYDAARADLERAISLDQDSYQAHFLLANVLVKLDETDTAIAQYRAAIKLSPDQPRSHYQLAMALLTKNNQAETERELAAALAIDGHYAPALIEMGKLLISQNRPSDAVNQLNLAVRDNPSAEQGYFLLAKAYSQLGDKEKSDEMAKRMVAVRSANWKSAGRKDSQPSAAPVSSQ